jgi:flagellar biosynthesis/type III secretory pathway M-ring protein FliF/YscJ
MINELKNWWSSVPKTQRAGLIVLAVFVMAVLMMSFGVMIGASLGRAL